MHYLVKYGYYGDIEDIKKLLVPLLSLLDGRNDKPYPIVKGTVFIVVTLRSQEKNTGIRIDFNEGVSTNTIIFRSSTTSGCARFLQKQDSLFRKSRNKGNMRCQIPGYGSVGSLFQYEIQRSAWGQWDNGVNRVTKLSWIFKLFENRKFTDHGCNAAFVIIIPVALFNFKNYLFFFQKTLSLALCYEWHININISRLPLD